MMLVLSKTAVLAAAVVAVAAAMDDHHDNAHGANAQGCRNKDGTAMGADPHAGHDHDHSAHGHRGRQRALAGGGDPYLVRAAACGDWVPLISNYTATEGGDGGTYVRVFSDGSTTAQIDAKLMRDGAPINNASVMAHLHVGACTADPAPAFDANGERASTVGAHWTRHDSKDEMHFMFNTNAAGESEAMSCTDYEVDRTALSVVLHEFDHAQNVIGMEAKKLCCDLTWNAADYKDPNASAAADLRLSGAVAAVAAFVAAAGVTVTV